MWEIRIHYHKTPKCKPHHPSCGKDPEIWCEPMRDELEGTCTCTHWHWVPEKKKAGKSGKGKKK